VESEADAAAARVRGAVADKAADRAAAVAADRVKNADTQAFGVMTQQRHKLLS
jgi:hypothetical protein